MKESCTLQVGLRPDSTSVQLINQAYTRSDSKVISSLEFVTDNIVVMAYSDVENYLHFINLETRKLIPVRNLRLDMDARSLKIKHTKDGKILLILSAVLEGKEQLKGFQLTVIGDSDEI